MTASLFVRLMRRESRGAAGRVIFFAGCLALGVAAVVAVAGLASSLDRAIRSEARALLAADLVVEGGRPVPPEAEAVIAAVPGLRRAVVKEMATVMSVAQGGTTPGRSLLVELKVVDGAYPFYGRLAVEPERPLVDLLEADGAVVGPEVLARLGLAVGDAVRIGSAAFVVRGVVRSEPDRVGFGFAVGPRIFLSFSGLERAGLEAFGSRIKHRLLVKLADGATAVEAKNLKRRIERALPEGGWFEVETASEAQPALREGIRRAERFLGLVALVSLLVGGIGIAQTVRAWIRGRMDAIAVLRCLGMRPNEIAALYLGQALLLAAAGSFVGAVLGMGAIAAAVKSLGSLVPSGAVSIGAPWALGRGVALGIGAAALFSAPQLLSVRRVPPVRVLRHDAEPLPMSRTASGCAALAAVAGVFGAAWLQSGAARLALGFTAGAVVAAGILAAAAIAITRAAAVIPRGAVPLPLKHGVAALARPGAGTIGSIVAIGLGVVVVFGTWLVQGSLIRQLHADLPERAPTVFLVDVQTDQIDGVAAALAEAGATRVQAVPIITARLAAIDGRPAAAIAAETSDEGRARWVLTREQRITVLRELPADNRVVAGALWSRPDRAEVSIERDFARDLGVGLGATLTFDVQGVPVDVLVTSLRTVNWRTFGINFFLVVEPGVLDDAPQARVAVARLSEAGERAFQDRIAMSWPNVTMLRIRDVLDRVATVLDRIGLAVRIVGGFTVAAGIVILAGAISASSARRAREVALLKALGATRGWVVATFTVEYALVGAVAAAIGSIGAGVLSWAVLTQGMEIAWRFDPAPYGVAIAAVAALAAVAGVAASARALASRPVEVLRRAV